MDSGDSTKGQEESTATLLFCRMCQAVYRQPKILPCLHSFCRPCLVNAVSHTALRGTVIVCPLCSSEARLPPNGIVGVPDNGFLNRLCQEYVSEVQSHLVARSLHAGAGRITSPRTSEFSALRTRLSDELTHPKFSPSTSPNRSVSSRPSSVSSSTTDDQADSGDVFPERGPATDRAPSSGALEAIRNMSRIQAKIMSLQGEALRVTYTIDNVNQSMIEWHQHKEDLKRAVQRRAAQYQFYIKRLEHQLTSQIDSKSSDDSFYAESDKCKSELRKNLKNILHEVSVLKIIQERGKDAEINALSASLLGESVGMSDVSLSKFHYDLNVPGKSIEEIVNENFGKISLVSESVSVFNPEIVDFTQMVLGSSPEAPTAAEDEKVQTEQKTEMFTEEDIEEEFRRSKKRNNEKRSRRHNTDLGLNRTDVQDYLAQFQTARETFRNRRREILLQGQQNREDASPVRHEIRPRPRSGSRNGRVQSLDRSAMPVTRGRSSLPGLITNRPDDLDTIPTSNYVAIMRPTDISLPSPVIEEASIPGSPVRSLVKQVSDPRYNHPVTSPPSSNVSTPIIENQILDQDEKLSSSAHSSRRHSSDLLSPLAQQGRSSVDILDRSSRPVRRALSAVGDRKSKMEFLRENWQRRKEILIQSEGFVSPESQQMKASVRPAIRSPPVSPVLQNITNRAEGLPLSPRTREASASALSPPMSPDDPKLGPMQQLRSRLSHFRQIIGGNASTKSKEEGGKSPEVDRQPAERPDAPHIVSDKTSTVTPSIALAQVVVSPVTSEMSSKPAFDTLSQVNAETIESVTTINTSTLREPLQTSTLSSSRQTTTALGSKMSTPAAATPSTLPPAAVTTISSTSTTTPTAPTTASSPTVTTTSSQAPSTTTGYVSRYGLSTSSYTSRYSKTYTKPTETFDAAAMIAAMYRGNEKSIIGSTPRETTPTATTTTISFTTSTTTTSSSTITTVDSVPSPVTSAPPATTSPVTDTTISSSLYTGRQYSRYSTGRNYTQDSALTVTSTVTTTPSTISPVSPSFATSVSASTLQEPGSASPALRTLGTYQSSFMSAASDVVVPSADPSCDQPDTVVTPGSTSPQPSSLTSTNAIPDVSPPDGVTPGGPKPKFESRRSRYSGQGFNRRHTIEVGKGDIEAALALQSNPQSQSITKLTAPSLPPLLETDHHEDLTSITFHSGQRRAAGRFVPAPLNLEPMREAEAAGQQSPARVPSSLSAAVAAIKSPSLSPTSPESSNMKAKIRDIARKKKERWRHLTIH